MIKHSALPFVVVLMSACAIKPIEEVRIERHILYMDQQGDLRSPDENYVVIPDRQENKDNKTSTGTGPSVYGEMLMRGGEAHGELTCKQFTDANKAISGPGNPDITPSKPTATPEEKYVIGMIAGYCESSDKVGGITLFVHGGLNTRSAAVNRVYDLTGQMLNDKTYPIFVGWRAGAWSNLKAHIFFDRGGEYRRTVGPATSLFIVAEDVLRSIGKAPRAMVDAGTQQVMPTPYKTRDERAYDKRLLQLIGPEVPRCDSSAVGKGATSLNICKREAHDGVSAWESVQLANPLKYLTAPLVEGFGTGTWMSLLRRTDLLLQKDDAYREIDDLGTALEKLLNAIERLDQKPRLNLIGHSMGCIIANNIISRHPGLDYSNIVYMAAAASLKDVEFAVVPQLVRNPKVSFYNLSLDPYREVIESYAFGILPNGSLLNWVDNYFAQISSFSDRTAGSWYNMIRTADSIFPPDIRNRVHLTAFGLPQRDRPDYDPGPQNHGEFGDYRFWVDDFWTGRVVKRSEIRENGAEEEKVRNVSTYLD